MAIPCQFCTFYLDGLFFGVDVQRVLEVLRYREMTRVPLASPVLRGLINLRGQIVPAIDLRRRLELPDRPAGTLPMNVVIRAHCGTLSLLVDEIGDVLDITSDHFERPPATVTGRARELIQGAYKLPDHLLLVLDVDRVADLPAN